MSLALSNGLSFSCVPHYHIDREDRIGMLKASASIAGIGGFGFCGAALLHGSPLFLGLTAAISGVGLLGCWPSTGCHVPICSGTARLQGRVAAQDEAPPQQGFEGGATPQDIALTKVSSISSIL